MKAVENLDFCNIIFLNTSTKVLIAGAKVLRFYLLKNILPFLLFDSKVYQFISILVHDPLLRLWIHTSDAPYQFVFDRLVKS